MTTLAEALAETYALRTIHNGTTMWLTASYAGWRLVPDMHEAKVMSLADWNSVVQRLKSLSHVSAYHIERVVVQVRVIPA